jgi:non-specific protein-tyrosine kinase
MVITLRKVFISKMDNNIIEERTSAETFSDYANLLWHWAWLLILCALLAGGTAYWVSRNQTPIYQASTLVMIDAAPSTQTVTYTALTTSEQLAATYAKVMTTTPVLDGVAERLGLAAFPLTASVQVQPILNTQLMTVVVQDTDPKRAALLANTLVQVFSDQIQADQASRYADSKKGLEDQLVSLEQQIQTTSDDLAALGNGASNQSRQDQLQTALAQYRQSYASVLQSYEQIKLTEAQSSSGIIQKDPAIPADAPIKPRPVRDAVLAAVVGLMLAAGIVFLIEFLDDTIRDPQEITRKWGVPVLGTIVRYKHDKNELITAKQPRSPITEAFRALRTNLQFASFNLPIHTLLVTSPSPEDGKTTVAVNLASVIAQGGRKVVVVDADLRRPGIHKILQIPNRVGLTDQFIRPQDLFNGVVKQTEIAGLHALTSGNLPPNPSELLSSERMSEILRQLASQFDTTILDAPPILLVTDALVLAPRVDGVLVVIKPSVTKRAALKNLLEQLHQVGANVIGVVLNDVKIDRSRYYYQRYYYYQKYSKGYHVTEPSEASEVTGVGGSRKPALSRDKKDTQEEKFNLLDRP